MKGLATRARAATGKIAKTQAARAWGASLRAAGLRLSRLRERLRFRLSRRPDTEHIMAVNRIAIASIFLAGASLFNLFGGGFDLALGLTIYVAYCLGALAIIGAILWRPGAATPRRALAMGMDILAGTTAGHIVGPVGAGFLLPCYILIIYGYGFRYGVRWLAASSLASFAAFGAVVFLSSHWRDQMTLAIGLLVGLVIIPVYAHWLVRSLWRAKAQAEDSNRAKSLFVAAVSHDLRTPLNAIIGLGDLLTASRLPAQEREFADMIGQSGRTLLRQIDSILDFSRLDVGAADLRLESFDLHDLLREYADLLGVSAKARGLDLILRMDGPVPRWIVSSPRAFRDSLNNLIGNAIKFTHRGHVCVAASARAGADGLMRVRIEVRDTGVGIPREAQKRIFERFTQADESVRDSFGGAGLGLAIVSHLVRAAGGDLGVESEPGRGACFWFEVEAQALAGALAPPLRDMRRLLVSARADLAAAPEMAGAGLCAGADHAAALFVADPRPTLFVVDLRGPGRPAGLELLARALRGAEFSNAVSRSAIVVVGAVAAAQDWTLLAPRAAIVAGPEDLPGAVEFVSARRLRPGQDKLAGVPARQSPRAILVVEDNRTNQRVIAKMLERLGHGVTIAENGAEALAARERGRFDLVLMDVNMPVMDGIAATQAWRAAETPGAGDVHGARTPVIALTADVTPETRARCVDAGLDDCATKPLEFERLARLIERWALRPGPGEAPPPAPAPEEASAPALDSRALDDLAALGGQDFVREIAEQFVCDAAQLLKNLAQAARDGDVERFRDEAHALRSCSANVGARSIYESCLRWREADAREIEREGQAYVVALERAYAGAREELEPWLRAG